MRSMLVCRSVVDRWNGQGLVYSHRSSGIEVRRLGLRIRIEPRDCLAVNTVEYCDFFLLFRYCGLLPYGRYRVALISELCINL